MRHPAPILTRISRSTPQELEGSRYLLVGKNEFVIERFRQFYLVATSEFYEVTIEPENLRASFLSLREKVMTVPSWERPVIWVNQAEILLGQMTYPEDFPLSRCSLVLVSEAEEAYCPPSFTPVSLECKGQNLQDLIRWMLEERSLNAELSAIRFLASEMKENLHVMAKLLDGIALSIHPRTVVSTKDLELEDSGWDSTELVTAIVAQDERKSLEVVSQALDTFHPKGVLTVLSRRVALLMLIKTFAAEGQPETSEVKPWIWKQNSELAKELPFKRLAQLGLKIDRAYSTISIGTPSMRFVLLNSVMEMCRVT